jgi:hypothetical protein
MACSMSRSRRTALVGRERSAERFRWGGGLLTLSPFGPVTTVWTFVAAARRADELLAPFEGGGIGAAPLGYLGSVSPDTVDG